MNKNLFTTVFISRRLVVAFYKNSASGGQQRASMAFSNYKSLM